MSEEERNFNLVIKKINTIIDSSSLFTNLVRKVIIEAPTVESIYWSLSQTNLVAIENALEALKVNDGGSKNKFPALGLLKKLNSILFVYCEMADLKVVDLIDTFVVGMERSSEHLGVDTDTLLLREESLIKKRILRNQTWLFTLCLMEYAIYNPVQTD